MLDTWMMAVMIMARERHNVVPMAIFCCRRIETFQRRRRGMVMTTWLSTYRQRERLYVGGRGSGGKTN